MFQQMMRTGAEVQGNNIRAMQELFETFWPTTGTPPASGARTEAPARPDPAPAQSRRPSPGGKEPARAAARRDRLTQGQDPGGR